MMSFIDLNDDQRWVPTHVNVTVLRARGLRTKGKHGGSRYVYTIIQVGKEKYTTGLVEKATVPEWNEECCFELLPGILEDGVRSAFPSGSGDLVLTIMHRVLIGLDVFLGQAILPLDKIFQDGMCPRDEWLKLNSKAGRKEKERGEIQVTVQFTRNNLTASMFDLTMKDKPRSAFGKLKDRVTGRKIGDMESSSAIVPGRFATLSGSLGKPFREGDRGEGGEDPVEVAEEKRSKVKDFFKGKGKLRSSSDTRLCSSLASESSVLSLTSERPCPPPLDLGILVDPSSPPSSPIYSNKVKVDTHHRDTDLAKKVLNNTQSSPKILTHNRTLSDEASRITTTAVPQPYPAVESLKGQGMTPSQSSLCINGSHIYRSKPVGPKGSGTLPSKLVLLEKCSPLSRSLQNLTKQSEDNGSAGEGRRWSFDKVNKEDEYVEKEAVPHVSQVQSAQVGGRPVLAAASMLSSNTTVDSADKRKKLRKSLFSGGKSDSLPAKLAPSQGCPLTEGRLRGWFGSSDSQNKPRLEVSSKVESDSDTPPPLPPRSPIPTQCSSSTGRASPDSGHPTNTFTPFLTPNPISPSNPFLPCLQCNPFFEDLITEEARRSPCATCSPCHSTALPCIPSTTHDVAVPKKMAAIRRERPRPVARQTSLPALLPRAVTASLPNPFTSRSISESLGRECDESFDAFASSRLNSPKSSPTNHPSNATLWQAQVRSTPPHKGNTIPPIEEMRMSEEEAEPPPLPPRRPITRPLVNKRSSDSWLHRGQELAVQKEACLLSQTGAASLQHTREGGHKRCTPSPHLYPSLGKDLLVSSDMSDFHTEHSQHYANISPESPSPFKSEDDFKNFEDLHAKVAPNVRSPMSARLRPGVSLHASSPSSVAPSLVTETNAQAKLLPTPGPSSIHHPPILRPSTGANATFAIAPCTSSSFSSSSSTSSTTVQPLVDARHTLLPEETQPASSLPRQESSPHPVKPLTTTASQGEKKEGRSFLEKLKSSIHSGLAAKQTLAEAETEIEESLTDRSAQYEQLTKMELISLLLQQQMDMENQKAASEQQAVPLKKHEAEMKKIKAQVRDLEDYIDRLLVQIMEQTPTLLQVRSRHK
ncbi:rab11 family-interacting protein 1 [Oncorhynchus clarkii lewisi]|uniref:rab11 family-interacting protein 1 n=1 Tax=Oncorhynchus clarkii lewisi TaxID=490388 RepID=UPI0039B876E2